MIITAVVGHCSDYIRTSRTLLLAAAAAAGEEAVMQVNDDEATFGGNDFCS